MIRLPRKVPLAQLRELLPPALLDRMAIDYQIASKDSIKLSGPLVFSTVLHGLLYDSKVSLRCMADKFEDLTGVELDHSTLGKRLRRLPCDYFSDIFAYLSKQIGDRINPRSPGPMSVRKVDATIVSLTAKWVCFGLTGNRSAGKAKTLVKAVFELHGQMPNMLRLCRDAAEHNDNIAIGSTVVEHCVPGELWVFDRGCRGRDQLLAIHEKSAFFLTPQCRQHLAVHRVVWAADPAVLPTEAPGAGEPDYVVVRVEACCFQNGNHYKSKKYAQMPLTMVHGLRYDQRGKCWQPLVLLTNMPLNQNNNRIGPYTFLELARVYRERWQIETFFKKIKGHLSYDHLLSRDENGIKIMIYMCLIAALLMTWVKEITLNENGWRSVKFWLEVSCRDWIEQLIAGQYHLRDRACRAP
jgi:hypothetical protein